ncbi:hypothetical protein HDU86_000732 [Geranomyces michiganensis]|nr:hypothetical protein HDU86_000732 [Geranomyces michiganensis]
MKGSTRSVVKGKKGHPKVVGGAVVKPKIGLRGKRRAAAALVVDAPNPTDTAVAESESSASDSESLPTELPEDRVKKVYPPSGKKGKKFADHAQALALIEQINDTEESRVGKKLERNQRIQKIDAERTVKKQKNQNTKRAHLEQVKKELRAQDLLKKKRRKKAAPVPEEDTGKKKVTFQV